MKLSLLILLALNVIHASIGSDTDQRSNSNEESNNNSNESQTLKIGEIKKKKNVGKGIDPGAFLKKKQGDEEEEQQPFDFGKDTLNLISEKSQNTLEDIQEALDNSFAQWKWIHDLKPEVDMQIVKGSSFDLNLGETLKLSRNNNPNDEEESKSKIEDEISLSDMKQISLFTSDARILVDQQELIEMDNNLFLPQPKIFTKTSQDWNILLFQDSVTETTQRIFSSIYGETFVDMIRLDDDDSSSSSFGQILPGMIDKMRLNQKYRYGHDNIQNDREYFEIFNGDNILLPEKTKGQNNNNNDEADGREEVRKNRKLRAQQQQHEEVKDTTSSTSTPTSSVTTKATCTEYTPIQIAIAFDSTYCAEMGGTQEKALEDITQIMAQVSQMYKQPGICVNLEVSYIEGFCDPEQDPYKDIVSSGLSGCGNSGEGALQELKSLWNGKTQQLEEEGIQRNFLHLFSGTPMECDDDDATNNLNCIIGCAYWDVMCRPSFGYGLSHVTFSPNQNLRAVLVAHEIGHNHGADHFFLSTSNKAQQQEEEKTSLLFSEKPRFSPSKYMSERRQPTGDGDNVTKLKELRNAECESAFIMNEIMNDGSLGFSEQSVKSINSNIEKYISGTCN